MPLTYRSTSCDSFREKLLAGDDIPNQLESTALNESSDQQDVEMDTIKTRRRGQVSQYFRKIWYIVLCSLAIWGAYSLFDRAAPEVQRYISAKHTSLAQSHPPAKLIKFVTGLEALGHDHHHQADNEAHRQLQLAQHDTHRMRTIKLTIQSMNMSMSMIISITTKRLPRLDQMRAVTRSARCKQSLLLLIDLASSQKDQEATKWWKDQELAARDRGQPVPSNVQESMARSLDQLVTSSGHKVDDHSTRTSPTDVVSMMIQGLM